MSNMLCYGNNLNVLPSVVGDESVDLIYLDPPFNSARSYNVLFRDSSGEASEAQLHAFDDTWHWTQEADAVFDELVGGGAPSKVADALVALRGVVGKSDVGAYLVTMTASLVQLHRTLRKTGTLYLHCDPTASHYLKILCDALFGPQRFGNEIIWAYKYGGRSRAHFGRKHDVILRYTKSNRFTFNSDSPNVRIPHEEASLRQNYRHVDELGRRYREGTWKSGKKYRYYADEGRLRDDVWVDINSLHQADKERLGYPTQKPLALLELIIQASSNEGDTVLDPFCGCGTTVEAAQATGRRWVGIDISYLAIDLIRKRLRHRFGDAVDGTYEIHGVPADLSGAVALFEENEFDFERWAVSLIDGQPKDRPGGDLGIDGRIRFHSKDGAIGQGIISVKGGKNLNPGMVRDLVGTVERERADFGVMITLRQPTRGMTQEAAKAGSFTNELTGQTYPRIQIVKIEDLMDGAGPAIPTPILPYMQARPSGGRQMKLNKEPGHKSLANEEPPF